MIAPKGEGGILEPITLAQAQESGLIGKLCRRLFTDERLPVDEMSYRTANCLQNAGIEAFAHLVVLSGAELLKTKNFGKKSLKELDEFLLAYGLQFGMVFADDLTAHLNAWLADAGLSTLDDWLGHYYAGSKSHRQTLPPEPDPSVPAPKLSDTLRSIELQLRTEMQRLGAEIKLLEKLSQAVSLGLTIGMTDETPEVIRRLIERTEGPITREHIAARIALRTERREKIGIAFQNIKYHKNAFDRVIEAIMCFEKTED